jgi:threonine dehydratase
MPDVIDLARIRAAAERIKDHVPPSALKESMYLSKRTGIRTFLKLENLNLSGSFKIRGAVNAILRLSPAELARGVIAASAGNHAQGVAYACRLLGAKATIFMPERAPLVKAEATRDLGADVRLIGQTYDEACQAALEHAKVSGGVFVHGFSHPDVIAGQGTIGLELAEQLPDVGLVIASIGGGGMMSGLATAMKALKPEAQVVGVQAANYPAFHRSRKEGRLTPFAAGYTIADGIAIKEPSEATWNIISKTVDDILLVDEESIASAVMSLMEWDHMLAEGAGAAPVAALLAMPPARFAALKGRSIACVISGGNIDVNLLKRIIPNGLKHSGSLFRVAVRIVDRPGRLGELLNLIGKTGANLQEVQHNRLFGQVAYEDVEVHLDLETTNLQHQEEVVAALTKAKLKYAKLD